MFISVLSYLQTPQKMAKEYVLFTIVHNQIKIDLQPPLYRYCIFL